MTIAQIPEGYVLVNDNQKVALVKDNLGAKAREYDGFFVKIEDGGYISAYGFYGMVPLRWKQVEKLL